MKKLISFVSIILILAACVPAKTTVSGMQNVSFLEFYTDLSKNTGKFEAIVDNENKFEISANPIGKNKMKSTRYEVKPGNHTIEVLYNGNSISKDVYFIGVQETRKINLYVK